MNRKHPLRVFFVYGIILLTMGSINIGHLYKKRTIRNLDGSIKFMEDEANGGVLIRNGQVINQERINELARIEEDKRKAATAFTQPAEASPDVVHVERNTVAPKVGESKVEQLEKKVEGMENNIAAILALLQKPKRTRKPKDE